MIEPTMRGGMREWAARIVRRMRASDSPSTYLKEKLFRKGRKGRKGKQSQQDINTWVLGSLCVLCVLRGQKKTVRMVAASSIREQAHRQGRPGLSPNMP